MDCREFGNKHVAFVDDLLPAFEMDAMQRHVSVCSSCSRQDTRIRRSLLVVRNLPPIEASPDFFNKLNARLAELGPDARTDVVARRNYFGSAASFAALAAGIAAVAYMAVETNNYFAQPEDFRLGAASSVASAPSIPSMPSMTTPTSITSAALVASVPTGIPVWPAVLMVGQTPMHFASADFRDTEER
jgi:hypothetical protein